MDQTEPNQSLSSIFDEGFELYNYLNNCTEPTNSQTVQNKINNAIKLLEDASKLVSVASLFSSNESIEEIATGNLKFLLLPAILGLLKLKICGGDRKAILDAAEVYFKDFLVRTYDYGLTNINVNDSKKEDIASDSSKKSETEIIAHLVMNRHSKIQRYQEGKELESKLTQLKNCFDEDVKREYYLTLIKYYIHQITDELKSIDMERPMLEMLNARKAQLQSEIKPNQSNMRPPPPLKPIVITKDDVQKAVFGAGYPSLPVMTVQEFYDKRVQDGVFPSQESQEKINRNLQNMSLQERALAGIEQDDDEEKAKEDEQEDRDDPELLERLRRRDEMKDEFRRGYGNRMNRS